jgi:UDP-galactopyranose mutase
LKWRCSKFDLVKEYNNLRAPVLNTPAYEFNTVRMTDMSLIYGCNSKKTIISHESTSDTGEKTYPIPTDSERTKALALKETINRELKDWKIAGRLGTYNYINMDQAIANGINVSNSG